MGTNVPVIFKTVTIYAEKTKAKDKFSTIDKDIKTRASTLILLAS